MWRAVPGWPGRSIVFGAVTVFGAAPPARVRQLRGQPRRPDLLLIRFLDHTSWHMGEIHYSRSRVPFTPTMSLLSQPNSLLTSPPQRCFVEQKVVRCESQAPSFPLLRRSSRCGVWRYRSCSHRPSKCQQRGADKLVHRSLHRRTGQGLQGEGCSAREGSREGQGSREGEGSLQSQGRGKGTRRLQGGQGSRSQDRSRQGRRYQGCRRGKGQGSSDRCSEGQSFRRTEAPGELVPDPRAISDRRALSDERAVTI